MQARIERLERLGIIERFTVVTSEAHERGRVRAFVAVTHAPKTLAAVEAQLRAAACGAGAAFGQRPL